MDEFDNMSEDQLNKLYAQKLASQSPQQGDQFDNMSEDEINRLYAEKLATSQSGLSQSQAGLEAFGQGASFGYLPQLQAAAEPLTDAIGRAADSVSGYFSGQPTSSEVDQSLTEQGFSIPNEDQSYLQRRDQNIERQQAQKEQFPITTTAGEIAGGLTTALATSGIGQSARGASLAKRIGSAAKAGAAYAAIQNPGDVKSEYGGGQVLKRLENALSGAATGAVFQLGAEGVGGLVRGIKKLPAALDNMSNSQAIAAAGGERGSIKKVLKENRISLKQAGKDLFKSQSALGDKAIIEVGDDIQAIYKKIDAVKKHTGEIIGGVTKSTDDIIGSLKSANLSQKEISELNKSRIDLNQWARMMKKQASNSFKGKAGGTSAERDIHKIIDELASDAGDDISLAALRDKRLSVDDRISWGKSNEDLNMTQKFLKRIRDNMQDMTKQRIRVVDEITNGNNLSSFNKANREYSQYKTLLGFAENKLAASEGNKVFSIMEGLTGGAAATIGGLPGFLVGVSSSRAVKKWGGAIGARALKRTAQVLEKDPARLGKFSDMIANAYSQNPDAAIRMIVDLQQGSPEFRDAISFKKEKK